MVYTNRENGPSKTTKFPAKGFQLKLKLQR